MADTESRNSILFVAGPSLLLAALVAAMIGAYAGLGALEPDPPQTALAQALPRASVENSLKSPVPDVSSRHGETDAANFSRLCGPDRQLHMGREVSVGIVDCHHPIRLRYANVRITIRQRPIRDGHVPESAITFRRHGLPPQRILVSAAEIGDLTFRVGRLDRSGAYYIMVRSFTAGFHCCFGVNLVIPEGPDRGTVELGYFDANAFDGFDGPPSDIDGDGRTDFVIRDDRFYYRFAPYAGMDQPPRIWNIRHGRAIEVSAARRYRPLFQRDMAGRRADCLQPESEPFGVLLACPAFVATAARLGQFRRAWRDMLSVYNHARDDAAVGERFPHQLRRFLRSYGYLPA